MSNFIEHIELTGITLRTLTIRAKQPTTPHKRRPSQIRFLAPPQTTITNFKPTARIKSTLRARNPEREHTIPTNPTKPPRPKGIQSPKKLTHTASDGASGVGVDLPWRASSSTGTAAQAQQHTPPFLLPALGLESKEGSGEIPFQRNKKELDGSGESARAPACFALLETRPEFRFTPWKPLKARRSGWDGRSRSPSRLSSAPQFFLPPLCCFVASLPRGGVGVSVRCPPLFFAIFAQ